MKYKYIKFKLTYGKKNDSCMRFAVLSKTNYSFSYQKIDLLYLKTLGYSTKYISDKNISPRTPNWQRDRWLSKNYPGIIAIPGVSIVQSNIEIVNPLFPFTFGKGLCSRNPGCCFFSGEIPNPGIPRPPIYPPKKAFIPGPPPPPYNPESTGKCRSSFFPPRSVP